MFLQNCMLLALDARPDTCPQEAWASRVEAVASFASTLEELMLLLQRGGRAREPRGARERPGLRPGTARRVGHLLPFLRKSC